jgi:hypothetical protein
MLFALVFFFLLRKTLTIFYGIASSNMKMHFEMKEKNTLEIFSHNSFCGDATNDAIGTFLEFLLKN